MKKLSLLILALFFVGCASYIKRQQCSSINWFEHGQSVALRGQWLNADNTVLECRKVEADVQESQLDLGFKSGVQKYCSPEKTFLIGKTGALFSKEICQGPNLTQLTNQYNKGLNAYCAKSNARTAGLSGQKYLGVCPENLERGFLPEYRQGRKKYVTEIVRSKETEERELSSQVNNLERELSHLNSQKASAQSNLSIFESQRNAIPASQNSQAIYLDGIIQNYRNQVNASSSRIYEQQNILNSFRSKLSALQKELSEFRNELPSLD